MNAKKLLFAALIVVAVALVGSFGRAGDEKKENAPKADEMFAGKIMMLHLDPEMEVLAEVLSDVSFVEIHGRTFLVGVGADTKRPDDWQSGKKVYVGWERVTGYTLLSKEEFDEYLKALTARDHGA